MPIVVTAACRPYWRYQVHELTEGTVIPDGEFADHLRASGAPVDEHVEPGPAAAVGDPSEIGGPVDDDADGEGETEDEGPGVDIDGDGVPEGNIQAVLGWVGDDPAKAARALEAEGKRETPRATLIATLEKLAQPAESTPQG